MRSLSDIIAGTTIGVLIIVAFLQFDYRAQVTTLFVKLVSLACEYIKLRLEFLVLRFEVFVLRFKEANQRFSGLPGGVENATGSGSNDQCKVGGEGFCHSDTSTLTASEIKALGGESK